MESGTIIHHILRKMLEDYLKDRDKKSNTQDLTDQDLTNQDLTNQDLTNQDLTVMIQYYLDEYINNIMGGCNGKDNRFMYLYKNLRKNLETALNYLLLEIESSEFKPYKLEMDIDWDKEVQPLTLETLEGEQIVISGKIDRVDVFEKDGEKYIRIIDYKSGNKRFNLEDINYGLNMQMMLYLLILCQCGKGDLRGVKPAGILYMPVQRKVVTGMRGYNSEQIEKYHMDNMKMSGIMSDDIEILNAMEKGIEGKFIPAKLKKDGALSSTSSVVKINEMHKLMINIKDIVLNMAESIYCGDLPAVPTDHSKYDVCSYCEYKSICKKSGGNE
jgi:ATP-dependent helicase/nuclease subunit B